MDSQVTQGQVIPFPLKPRTLPSAAGTAAYDFWFDVLGYLPRRRRDALIHQAYVLGLIDERDREIFIDMWADARGRR